MKKILFLALFCLTCFFITDNVSALSYSGVQTFYYDADGVSRSNSKVSTSTWAAYNVAYNNVAFGGGSFSDIPNLMYGFFPSGLGCANKNCVLEGVVVAKNTNSNDGQNFLSSMTVQLESNRSYKNCSITNLSTEYNLYSYATFQCAGYNLNTGFNVVVGNLSTSSNTYTYYGFAYNNFQILDNLTADDIIVNNNSNTQDIINNQNQNSQNEINNATQNKNDIINNQNQNQQQTNEKLENLNDSLTNSNVEGGTGSSFFNDFKTNDNGGISSIITSPLVAINSMLDNTCSPMSVTYKGKEVSLPCGTEFWAKASTIQDYLNWFEGGILVYLIIRKLYKLIESMKNPDDDRVEVMDL